MAEGEFMTSRLARANGKWLLPGALQGMECWSVVSYDLIFGQVR